MAANVELLDPSKIIPNPDNPRLIFRAQDLDELEKSIASQGILVPLTVYRDARRYVVLDGERRWRCARKLGLHSVPVIVQAKPHRVQNIMMMFAIHNARRDWDPLPTALKLRELEKELEKSSGRKLNEAELAASASLSRGAVRRYRKILRIPEDLQKALLKELDNPGKQSLSVDQVIEAVDAAANLVDAEIIEKAEERAFVDDVIDKFRAGVIKNTVEPRDISKIARSAKKGELPITRARRAISNFQSRLKMQIDQLVSTTIEDIEQAKAIERNIRAFEERVVDRLEDDPALAAQFIEQVRALVARLKKLV